MAPQSFQPPPESLLYFIHYLHSHVVDVFGAVANVWKMSLPKASFPTHRNAPDFSTSTPDPRNFVQCTYWLSFADFKRIFYLQDHVLYCVLFCFSVRLSASSVPCLLTLAGTPCTRSYRGEGRGRPCLVPHLGAARSLSPLSATFWSG